MFVWLFLLSSILTSDALTGPQPTNNVGNHLPGRGLSSNNLNRRDAIFGIVSSSAFVAIVPESHALATDDKIPETFDVESYLRTGFVSNPMGVSGQAGKSRPETGV